VRARCKAGWAAGDEAALLDGRGDAELIVTARAGEYGFLARTRSGAEVAVSYERPVASLLPAVVAGQMFRVVGGVWTKKRSELEIKPWTEVFDVASEANR
jgi:hypothetical protein